MACKITVEALNESQEGTIGNDWKYDLEVKTFKGARLGVGVLSVPKHRLDSGWSQPPPGPPEALVLPAGEPGDEIHIEFDLLVAEVDVLENDIGRLSASHKLTCPAAGAAPVVEERELSVGVEEQPSGIGHAVFKLKLRLTAAND